MTQGDDGQVAVWQAVAELASAWADLPVVRRFAAQLPRNASQRSDGLPGLLQQVAASGAMVAGRPLRLGTITPAFLSMRHGAVPLVDSTVLSQWLQDAMCVERAHRATVAWLRSRLPGYPQIPAPQLARGTFLTTTEFTYRLAWTQSELGAGLQFQNSPAVPSGALGATVQDAARADEAVRRTALAFAGTTHWQRLRAAGGTLSPADRAELLAARRAVGDALKPALIDAHEPDIAVRRDAYRYHVVAEAIDQLAGQAREYAEAFGAVDQLLELAASDVFGQLAVYGTSVLRGVTELTAHGGGPGTVEFTVEDAVHFDTGAVVWLDDPLLPDAVHVTGLTCNFAQAYGVSVRATGQALVGTAAAWSRPTV